MTDIYDMKPYKNLNLKTIFGAPKLAAVAWTKALLTIWGTELVQKLLAKATRNKNIYEIVSKELSKVGVERNWRQCRDRIKNLLAKYRKTR